MSDKTDKFVSPLAKARGLGSAHEGAHHWMHQRITAVALIPLCIWLVISVVSLRTATHLEFITWLQHPVNSLLMIFFIIASFYHAALGCQVVIEDYIHCKWFKMTKLIGSKLFFLGGAIACIYAIIKIS
ncbi:MAG: succinate dehydrogenase, hydrophobic membrane anchor protein [Alphaproteobacteria bacterium]|nr:succinate dehydrogenase, hydrophobic membrane anchor protein [Alphaproteobacteria bacterium]